MKVAIYTICKNEEQFVDRFMATVKEADYVIVADTGSTDKTIEKLREHGAIVHSITVNPWRFDVARNISMSFIPEDADICLSIDLDEVLTAGWRNALEQSWIENPTTTRMRYSYVWNTLEDGRPGITFWYDKAHTRNGWRWVKPVHEILEYDGVEVQNYCKGFQLYHFPDKSKSRSNYLPLLEMGCKEAPEDDRNSHYLGREYMFYQEYDKSIAELKRHLSLKSATWESERASSMRFIARCYAFKNEMPNAEIWALRACAESPGEREPWVELGKVFNQQNKWHGVYFAMMQALAIKDKPMSYICEPESWGGSPYDYASLAAFHLGNFVEAVKLCEQACLLEPNDARLKHNLVQMKSKLNVQQDQPVV